MSEFEVFHHPQFGDIRAKVENGVDWFVAKDVCVMHLVTKICGMLLQNMLKR